MAVAERTSMAEGPRKEISRTIKTAKHTRNVARDLVRALYALESSLDFDFFGRVVWTDDEPADHVAREIADLLRLAREDYPSQEIEVSVRVRVPGGDPASGK